MSVRTSDGVTVRWKLVLFSTPQGAKRLDDGERSSVGQNKHSFAQGLGSTTSGNVFSASLTASSGKKAATHSSDALTHPRSGMLLFFPTEGGKHIMQVKGILVRFEKNTSRLSRLTGNFWEFAAISDPILVPQDLTEVWAYSLIISA